MIGAVSIASRMVHARARISGDIVFSKEWIEVPQQM